MPSRGMHEVAFSRGVNLAETPAWQRRGILVRKGERKVKGIDPRSGEAMESYRSEVVTDRDLPVFASPEGRSLLSSILRSP